MHSENQFKTSEPWMIVKHSKRAICRPAKMFSFIDVILSSLTDMSKRSCVIDVSALGIKGFSHLFKMEVVVISLYNFGNTYNLPS